MDDLGVTPRYDREGTMIEITCLANAWFNLLDSSGVIPNTDRDRNLYNTGTSQNLYGINKVLLCYTAEYGGRWLILDYQYAQKEVKHIDIRDSEYNPYQYINTPDKRMA